MMQKSPSAHHRITLSGWIFATKACIVSGKNVKQQYLLHTSPQHGELRPTSVWDPFGSLGHIHFRGLLPPECRHLQNSLYVQVLRSPILAALLHGTPAAGSAKLCGLVQGMELQNFRRGRHLYSAGRPSRWASAHILVRSCSELGLSKVPNHLGMTEDQKLEYETHSLHKHNVALSMHAVLIVHKVST